MQKSNFKQKLKKKLNLKLWFSAAICSISFSWLFKSFYLGTYPDFQTQYYAPGLAFNGVSPYSGSGLLFTPQVYPPTAFFFFMIFTYVDYSIAPIIYTGISIVCLVGTLVLLAKIFKKNFFSFEFLLLSSLVFVSFPVKFTLGMGQVNLILLFLITLSLYLLEKNRKFIAGLVLGVPLVVKFLPIFLPFYFLFKLNFRFLAGCLTSILLFILLSYLFIPHNIISEFFEILPSFFSSWKLDYYNQALSGFIGRNFGVNDFSTLAKNTISISLITLTYSVLLTSKIKKNPIIYGILINLGLIINTFSWQHHFVFLIIPFFTAYFSIKKIKQKTFYLITLVISYFLVSTNLKDPNVLPVIFQSHVLYGSLILYILQMKILLKEKIIIKSE